MTSPTSPGSTGRLAWGALLALAILALDQGTKALILAHLEPYEPVVLTSFFSLVLVWNRGVSFGLLTGAGGSAPLLLVALAVGITAFLTFWLWRERRLVPQAALWLVMAGALGNVADRLRHGAVVDFLDVHLAEHHWPAFNVADSAIVVGAALLLLDSLFLRRTTINEGAG